MHSRATALLLSVCCLLLPASAATAQPVQPSQPSRSSAWTDVDCARFDLASAPGASCGYVTAPLRHAQPDGPTIQLATVVLSAPGADRQADPLFMAQGGPGGSTILAFASEYVASPTTRPVLNRDIVLWDQRGTYYSRPALLCPELVDDQVRPALDDSNPLDSTASSPIQQCGDRLAAEVGDLSAFNSAENADDAETVRAALGYDQFNFYGVSYGTELGQFVMRRQPGHLRSVVLDAVVPLTHNPFTDPAFAMQRIGQKYFDACAADARCNAAFPNLGERYVAMIDRLNAAPVTVSVSSPPGSTRPAELPQPAPTGVRAGFASLAPVPFAVRLTGSLLESALFGMVYDSATFTLIPLIVDRADRGDFSLVSSLVLPFSLFDDKMAHGMYKTVTCASQGDTDPSTTDFSGVLPRLAEEWRRGALEDVKTCRQWGIETLPSLYNEPVHSALPTLLLSGEFDPITPPEYADSILPGLPNAQHVVFPFGAHGQVESICGNDIIQRFVDAPTEAVDATCAATQHATFKTEQDLITIPSLHGGLEGGVVGSLLGVGLSTVPGLLAVLFLMTALPVYLIGWIINRFRKRGPGSQPRDWTVGWTRAAPWLAFAATLAALVFLVGLGVALVATITTNALLLGLGAVSSAFRPLFALPPLYLALVCAMLVATAALWAGRRGSLPGRLYYTALLLAAVVTLGSFFSLGVMGLWRA